MFFFCCHPNCRFANLFLYLNPKMFHILWFTTKNFQSHSTLFFVVPCILYRLHNPFNSFNIIANYVHIYILLYKYRCNFCRIFLLCLWYNHKKKKKQERIEWTMECVEFGVIIWTYLINICLTDTNTIISKWEFHSFFLLY